MQLYNTVEECRKLRNQLSGSVALVPTMGALHPGHLRLVDVAKTQCDTVIVSIYINPTQFSVGEDLTAYPRRLESDLEKLAAHGVGHVYCPTDDAMYPRGYDTYVVADNLAGLYCGASRPHHFRGVLTIVLKLLHQIAPDVAVFGNKDLQQVRLVQNMCRDLDMTVKILGIPTEREADGLAYSSRNSYLSQQHRKKANVLFHTLQTMKKFILEGQISSSQIKSLGKNLIEKAGVKVDYLAVCQHSNLQEVTHIDKAMGKIALLGAVFVDTVRLIDNLSFEIPES